MGIALLISTLIAMVIAQWLVIYALVNRLLIQAKIPPMTVNPTRQEEAVPDIPRRKLFSVDIPS